MTDRGARGTAGTLLVVLLLLTALPAMASPIGRWSVYVSEASQRFGVPEAWIKRVMRAESGGRTTLFGRPIVSHAGAMGLMQLMPGTWQEMRSAHGLGTDPHQPRDNILAGTAYLRAMYDRFGYPGLFGAYNAGPARYAQHLRGRRLPAETVAYMATVTGWAPSPTPRAAVASAPPGNGSMNASGPPAVLARSAPALFAFRAVLSTSADDIVAAPPELANPLFVALTRDREGRPSAAGVPAP